MGNMVYIGFLRVIIQQYSPETGFFSAAAGRGRKKTKSEVEEAILFYIAR